MLREPKYKRANKNIPLIICLSLAVVAAATVTIFLFSSSKRGSNGDGTDIPVFKDGLTAAPGTSETSPPTAPPDYESMRQKLLGEADLLSRGYYYDEAIALLNAATPEIKNEQTDAKTKEIQELKDSLVKYEETQLYHIFFHSLILDTSLAFDNKGHPAEGYNMWMTTKKEFELMLPLLLENDFVLYDITKMADFDANGNVSRADIYLPEGKKPLVISIDDVNYYDYMKPDGFADRLDVDEAGNVVTVVKNPDGTESVTYDGDVMPILDAFVKEHPEFSFRGAKGVVALTGYQGAFGYRITDLEKYSADEGAFMIEKVKQVAVALRASGWQIANHSYTHNSYWTSGMTMDQLKYDVGRWKKDIMTYVGETNIMITPFGATFKDSDERFEYIVNEGFNIFCPVGSGMFTSFTSRAMRQDRLNLDGYMMTKNPERIKKFFFDPKLVLDSERPPLL